MRKHLITTFGLCALMLLSPLATAQTTWSIIQGGGGDFTTLAAAVAAAADGDTLSFDDGAATTYAEVFNLGGKALTVNGNSTTTIDPGAGNFGAIGSANGLTTINDLVVNEAFFITETVVMNDSTFQNSTVNALVVNSVSLVMNNCVVQNAPNNGININSGSVELNGVTVQNTGTSGAIRGAVRHGAGAGPITLNNCNLINNNSHGISLSAADSATVTLNNTNVRNNTDANIHSRDDGTEGAITFVATGGIIDGALLVRGNSTVAGGSGNHSFTLNNVQLGSTGGATFVNGPQAGFEMTWNDCTIGAGLGGVAFFLTQEVTININGSAGNLFDVGVFYDLGGALFVRALAGTVNFDYVTMDNTNFNILDCTFGGPLLGQVDLTISNSVFSNGAGIVNMVALDAGAQPVNSPFGTTFTAIDSIWSGDTGQGVKVAVRDDGNNLPSTMTLIRTTLTGAVAGGLTPYLISASDTLIATDSIIDGINAAGTARGQNLFLQEGTQIFTGCTLQNINAVNNLTAAADITFDGCTFTAVGDILYRMFSGGSLTFRNMTLDGTAAWAAPIGRATQGVLSFENVVFDGFGPVFNNADAEVDSYVGGFTVNMDQCEYRSLNLPLDIGGVDPTAYGAGSSITFNATNTIFQTNPVLGWVARVSPPAGAVIDATNVNLEHCTFYGGTAIAYLDVGPSATVVSNYTLVDDLVSSPQQAVFNTAPASISGTGNLLNIFAGVNGFDDTNLTASLFDVDPQLGPDGRLTGESPAGGAAVGSTMTIDVDGQPRPLNGTEPDIGADEDFSVPVELSGFDVI